MCLPEYWQQEGESRRSGNLGIFMDLDAGVSRSRERLHMVLCMEFVVSLKAHTCFCVEACAIAVIRCSLCYDAVVLSSSND